MYQIIQLYFKIHASMGIWVWIPSTHLKVRQGGIHICILVLRALLASLAKISFDPVTDPASKNKVEKMQLKYPSMNFGFHSWASILAHTFGHTHTQEKKRKKISKTSSNPLKIIFFFFSPLKKKINIYTVFLFSWLYMKNIKDVKKFLKRTREI